MNKEDKELLLKDLCARLPYGVLCHYETQVLTGEVFRGVGLLQSILGVRGAFIINGQHRQVNEVKPYLRPMSSMTEEERGELRKFCETQPQILEDIGVVGKVNSITVIDFLNSHHFDYRGLIEKGLALEALVDMYKIE